MTRPERRAALYVKRATKPVTGMRQAGLAGNGSQPVSESCHDGCCKVAPRRPHTEHRACSRSMSLDASPPQDNERHKRDGHTWPHGCEVVAAGSLGIGQLLLRSRLIDYENHHSDPQEHESDGHIQHDSKYSRTCSKRFDISQSWRSSRTPGVAEPVVCVFRSGPAKR
jgi:hypothetical protein